MKKIIAVGVLAMYLFGCARDGRLAESNITSYDAVEMFHLALRQSCDPRFSLQFTSALNRDSGRLARGGSYWLITSSKVPGKVEVRIVSPETPRAMQISTPKGSLWILVSTQESEAEGFLRMWNVSTMETWVQSLRENVKRHEAAGSWESEVPKGENP